MGDAGGPPKPLFFNRKRQIDVSGLGPIISGLVVTVVCLGGLLYPAYRIAVRPYLEAHDFRAANGAFELKEHFAALALLVQPAYWAAWQRPLTPASANSRRILTLLVAAIVWWNFLTGFTISHIGAPAL